MVEAFRNVLILVINIFNFVPKLPGSKILQPPFPYDSYLISAGIWSLDHLSDDRSQLV